MTPYKTKATWLIRRLIDDFAMSDFQGAGVAGNGYQESMLRAVMEADGLVTSPSRGIGWFQWTGPRHRAFAAWCAGARLDWHSDEAEYGFLKHELQSDYAHVVVMMRATRTLIEAVACFERYYEGAGIVAMGHRLTGAEIALNAWQQGELA